MVSRVVCHLRDREHEHKIEEQLDEGRALIFW